MSHLQIKGAREGNLKNISLDIPRNQLVVITGLSGSGKSTLAVDVIYQECQRQYLEAIGYQGIRKPDVDAVRNVSPAIRITQTESNRNPRSTLGTATDIYTDLRMVYEKLGRRVCPHCGREVGAADCREETEKSGGEFRVYMFCAHCGYRMEKLTRSHFSYNTREGACPECQGMGSRLTPNLSRILHPEQSLEDGAVDYWAVNYKEYQLGVLIKAFRHYGISYVPDTPVAGFSDIQKSILYYGVEHESVQAAYPDVSLPKSAAEGKFEGVLTTLWRRLADKGGDNASVQPYFDSRPCADCGGERLNKTSRSVTVAGERLPELSGISLEELLEWIRKLERELNPAQRVLVQAYTGDLATKIDRLIQVGLGYLSLDRQSVALSGGERQRVKLAAALHSELTGVLYIMDEPTIGLHPRDTRGMISALKRLRDGGNSLIVIEHDIEVMKEADYLVDIGPASGKNGGEVIGTGTLEELTQQVSSVTGAYLRTSLEQKPRPRRQGDGGKLTIRNASLHNLKQVHAEIPTGCLVAVTGVSGSGKSTLVLDVLAAAAETPGMSGTETAVVEGLGAFRQIVTMEQAGVARMKRSNAATFSGLYTEIRGIFGALEQARDLGLDARHFSFNTKGGRCEECGGLGSVTSNMLFFEDLEVICPSCGGNQFNDKVLSVKFRDHSIKDVLNLPVDEALKLFEDYRKLAQGLRLIQEVGLGYLELGQSLTTLSGGEAQRLKLARELLASRGKSGLYVMDEPTTGLHPVDVEHFLRLIHRMVDAGSTVIIVEHNEQVIAEADWILEMGPEGGNKGGELVYAGPPAGR